MTKWTTIAAAAALAACLAGCDEGQKISLGGDRAVVRPTQTERAEPSQQASYLLSTSVTGDRQTPGPSAVDSALRWSEKFAEVSEELVRVQQDKHALQEENRRNLGEIARLHAELDQARKELSDASAMMMTMRQEMARWKSNVLGFREEMRDAEKAQLEALMKILELLGGQVPPSARAQTQPPAAQEGDQG